MSLGHLSILSLQTLFCVCRMLFQESIILSSSTKATGQEEHAMDKQHRPNTISSPLKYNITQWTKANDARRMILLWLEKVSSREIDPNDFADTGYIVLIIVEYHLTHHWQY